MGGASLAASPETPRVGLPQEYAHSVLEALEAGARGRFEAGTLRIHAAVHGPVGSSPSFMARLAQACIELTLQGSLTDKDLVALLESVFLG